MTRGGSDAGGLPGDAAKQSFGANDTSHLFQTFVTWIF
jgi:hypothetical protein